MGEKSFIPKEFSCAVKTWKVTIGNKNPNTNKISAKIVSGDLSFDIDAMTLNPKEGSNDFVWDKDSVKGRIVTGKFELI